MLGLNRWVRIILSLLYMYCIDRCTEYLSWSLDWNGTTTFLQDGQFRISATVLRQGSTQVRLLFLGKPILSSPPRLVEISHRIPLLRKSNVVCDESVIPRVDEMFFCTVTFQDGGRQHLVASEHISSPSSLSLRVL